MEHQWTKKEIEHEISNLKEALAESRGSWLEPILKAWIKWLEGLAKGMPNG